MSDNVPVHRKNFVFGKSHYFIQQPDEWATGMLQLGEEHRLADGAFDIESIITVRVQDSPDLMDQIADFIIMPRYTALLEKMNKLQEMVDLAEAHPRKATGDAYFDGFSDGFKSSIHAINYILTEV